MKPMCIASFLIKQGLEIYLKSVLKYKLISNNEHSIFLKNKQKWDNAFF